MSALEYMFLDQHASRKFVSSYTPKTSGNGYDSKNIQIVNLSKTISQVVEKEIKRKVRPESRAHSASQTDPVNEDDFDWDLTDKNDSETQTRNPSSNYSDDVTVQTDQRTVFSYGAKKVSISEVSSRSNRSDKARHPKHSWSQTRWNLNDKDCQVKPADFEKVPKKQGWRRTHRRHHNHHHHITQGHGWVSQSSKTKESEISGHSNKNRRVNFVDDLDLPTGMNHKSSIVAQKAHLDRNQNLDLSYHIGVQTDHDPESSVSYYDTYKSEIYSEDPTFFHAVDVHVIEDVSARWYKSVKKLVKHIQEITDTESKYKERSDLVSVRGIFVWVVENIFYDPSLKDRPQETIEILRDKVGSRKDFIKIFIEMCQAADVQCKEITGFIKDDNYKPGDFFDKRKSSLESWVVVKLESDWRLVDPLLGAGEWSDETGYTPALTDHYFLTEPSEFLYTHFPHTNKSEPEYSRWQLVSSPISLSEFNKQPHLGSEFFTLGCHLRTNVTTPIKVQHMTEIEIHANEVLSYKYKLYHAEDMENDIYNNYALCTLDNKDRCLATFAVAAPDVGKYYLKIYALPEEELSENDGGIFNFLGSFLISFTKVIHNVRPWPLSSQPYGLTSAFHNLGVSLVIKDPSVWEDDRIVLIGGSKAVFKFVNNEGPIVTACHMYDHMGNELVEEVDKSGLATLFFLSNKHPIKKEEIKNRLRKGLIKTFVTKKETKDETIFTVVAPPNVGFYKLEIFGGKIPKLNGMLHLPLVAIYLVEVRLQFSSESGENEDKKSEPSPTYVYRDRGKLEDVIEEKN